jgi:D-alanine-D-alanine ligase
MRQKTIVEETILPKSENPNNNIHVALVYGGMSAERDVSLMSKPGFKSALLDLGYKVTPVDMGHDFAEQIVKINPDIVFNGIHGTYGEDGCLPGLLEILGIKYTHSGVLPSSIGFNKQISLEIFAQHGIKTAEYKVISKEDKIEGDPMPRPYVIKPISEGSSLGIEIIFEEDDFDFSKYQWKYGNKIIIQEYVKGREIQVAVLNNKAIGLLEVIPLKNRFYDYETKYQDGMAKHVIPVHIDKEIADEMMKLSEKAHNCINVKNINRVEFLYDETKGKDGIYILEVNTHPGMTPLSIVPEICQFHGISYQNIVNSLVQDGLES